MITAGRLKFSAWLFCFPPFVTYLSLLKNRLYKPLLKPILFAFRPERAHAITMALLRQVTATPLAQQLFRSAFAYDDSRLRRRVMGLDFPNPVGLAAGFDKDGRYYSGMAALGFGFVELGTVTPRPQAGNPKPRMFRLPADRALINRMGFNNDGVDALADRLQTSRPEHLVIGGNIGKNKDTPNEKAVDDYLYCFERLFPYVDYFVVNVSSPNTPGLRELQDKAPLLELLTALQEKNRESGSARPVLLKIAPDLNEAQLDDIIDIVETTRLAGVVATNTTISREGLLTAPAVVERAGQGGLSGAPVRKRATEVVRYIRQHAGRNLAIIGVGGIDSPGAALEKLDAGADLIQLYTGLIYAGPGLVKQIKHALAR